MVYELRSYTVRENKLQDFMKFYGEKALPLIESTLDNRGKLVGHWVTKRRELMNVEQQDIQVLDEGEVNYMLAFNNEEKRNEYWNVFYEVFAEHMAEWMSLCHKADNRIMETTEYHPLK
jgi:predicted small secreted protein